MKRIRLALFRHLPTDWNTQGRLQGHLDIPLSAESRGYVHALVARARELSLTAVWSSDLIRAVHTANPIAHDQRTSLRTDSRLREFHMGALEGLRKGTVRTRYPQLHHDTRDPGFDCTDVGGESRALVRYRMLEAMKDIFRRYAQGGNHAHGSGGEPRRCHACALTGAGHPLPRHPRAVAGRTVEQEPTHERWLNAPQRTPVTLDPCLGRFSYPHFDDSTGSSW